jgi:hypothetical protein
MSSDLSEKNTGPTLEGEEKGDCVMSSDILSEKATGTTLPAISVRALLEPSGRKAQKRRGPPPTTKTHNTQAPRINRPKRPTHGLPPGQKDFWGYLYLVPQHPGTKETISPAKLPRRNKTNLQRDGLLRTKGSQLLVCPTYVFLSTQGKQCHPELHSTPPNSPYRHDHFPSISTPPPPTVRPQSLHPT